MDRVNSFHHIIVIERKTCPSFTKQDDLSFQFYSRKNVHRNNLLQLFAAVRHKTCDITADTTRGCCYRVKLEQKVFLQHIQQFYNSGHVRYEF